MKLPINRWDRICRLLRGDTQGVTIIEFALVLPPLLIIVIGGLDLGYQAYLQTVLQGALNDVARSGSMESPSFDCDGDTVEAKIGCAVQSRSDVIARDATYSIVMKSFYDFSGVGRSEKLITDYNGNGEYDDGDCYSDLNENGSFDEDAGKEGVGGADDVVFYQASLSMPRLFPMKGLLGWDDNYTITAEMALRNQPYSRQKTPPTVCN
ncbi:TadE/TadG family type IV pilus assembly protein [Novosphingobium sp. PP1Y]|uniref:TadE/TadG family type IV pilus assembly protein n=1 Tax=Novosphingobium sp. PP1Y TaxID=702113 RepID=UPI00020EE65C|nr:TadE family protein [Novosphingobium sp. PP1Y]CCA89977.1 conserved hypothetical protein [Novosphingobium sp. PP1Y]